MVLCTNCAFFQNQEPNSLRADIWYNHFCHARERQQAINPQTGKTQYRLNNDLGRAVLTDDRYEYCRDINPDGDCQLFAPQVFGETHAT